MAVRLADRRSAESIMNYAQGSLGFDPRDRKAANHLPDDVIVPFADVAAL